jgi:hypothetical protein
MTTQDGEQLRSARAGSAEGAAPPVPPHRPALPQHDQDHLGRQLRAMYDDLLQEPIPGRFLALIARLERQDREQSHGR